MSGENENLFVVESQSLDVDEQKKKDISGAIESCNSLQDFIEKLEKEKLIWYFIGPLRKDEDITGQINLKWEKELQEFEQSINRTQDEIRNKFEKILSGQSFLAYSTKDNDFNIRFENKEEPIKISDILRASNENEVYNISLGKNSQITACKKNGNERHYNFVGSSSCEVTIDWQAKDSKGNSIDCSMTIEVGSDGIRRMVNEPKFGDLKFTDPLLEETKNEILKLVEQNKEVFINEKTLYQVFADMYKNINDQQITEERFTPVSPQSPAPDSSGYFSSDTLSSRRGSLSVGGEVSGEDEVFESDTFDDEEHGQGGNDLENRVKELEEENAYLKKQNAELRKLNQEIVEEGDAEVNKLIEEKQILEKEVIGLKAELERKTKELDSKNQNIKQLEQNIDELEQKLQDKDSKIANLKSQLKDKESEIQSTDKINEELHKKLEQSESELSILKKENAKEVEYENRGTSMQQNSVQDQGTQAVDKSSNKIVSGLRQENKKLTRDKLTISEQLKHKIREIGELKKDLNQLQEENKQLKQKTTKNVGVVDASSSTDQRETKEMEVQTDETICNLYDKEGKYVRTELLDPNLTPNDPEKSRGKA